MDPSNKKLPLRQGSSLERLISELWSSRDAPSKPRNPRAKALGFVRLLNFPDLQHCYGNCPHASDRVLKFLWLRSRIADCGFCGFGWFSGSQTSWKGFWRRKELAVRTTSSSGTIHQQRMVFAELSHPAHERHAGFEIEAQLG